MHDIVYRPSVGCSHALLQIVGLINSMVYPLGGGGGGGKMSKHIQSKALAPQENLAF